MRRERRKGGGIRNNGGARDVSPNESKHKHNNEEVKIKKKPGEKKKEGN